MNVIEIQRKAFPQITELLKQEPEIISSIEKAKDGWIVQCDVLEKKSIPETFDILKIFEFKFDNEAKVVGFKQLKKIRRGEVNQS
ncbi:MAG: gas vesicle protein [Nanoarchaeota archaeon]|nr:gas vesicle protein [Nanoarchaeota archaeon]